MGEKKRNNKPEKNGLNRRDFMRTTGSMAAVAGLTAGGLFVGTKNASASTIPKKWDEEFDVVVIGSGFAGLAAAYEAKKAGSSTIVLEKMPMTGGNSAINGGVVAAAGSSLQKKAGIDDSPDLLYKDMLKAGKNLNHPELARVVAKKSNEVVQWTIEELGVEYHDTLVHMGGHSVPRAYSTRNRSGGDIVKKQIAGLQKVGVEIRTRQMLARLLRDTDGRIKGVEVREGYRPQRPDSGTLRKIRAGKAVVLATGGFSNDLVFRTIQNPMLSGDVDCTNQPGATAEALLEALSIGATPIQISWIQVGPWTSPDEKGFGRAPHFVQEVTASFGVWIELTTGKRFVNEQADRKTRADAIIDIGHPCIALADEKGVSARKEEGWFKGLLKEGVVKKFNSLDELAEAYGVPVKSLNETIEKYNSFLARGKDEDFDRYIHKKAKPLNNPPYYACRIWPKVHHTMGGVQINTKAQVIDLEQKPIAGLYAAGEVSGGVHGAVRLGSCAVTDCLVFGRIAGQNAAAGKPWA